MSKKVEAEGEAETELYEKYMCYCKTSGGALAKSIADAETKIPEILSAIKESSAEKKQLDEDIKTHKADREAAKEAVAKATAIREKEKAAFEEENAELLANLDAIEKAVAAIEKGMSAFLQSSASGKLRKIVLSRQDMLEDDKEEVLSFLSSTSDLDAPVGDYAPKSGEIVGILKQLGDEMKKDSEDAIAAEEAAVKAYEELMAAKKKEINALTKMIEEKLARVAELGVAIATMKNDHGDTVEALEEDKKFLADLEKNCATKEKEWAEIVKNRQMELQALAETIKILNDDDALELFKKTLPSLSQQSFMQIQVTSADTRARALALIQEARRSARRPELDLIALTLSGKKIGFEKVIQLIDEMVATLKKEQLADHEKKEYCLAEFDKSDDKKKSLERAIADLETAIAKITEAIAATKEEVAALTAGIKALDKAVAEAAAQRKEEHEDYTTLMAQDSAAKEVILFAKNRLNKFYNPKMYTPPPKRDMTEEERLTVNMGGTLAPTAPPAGIAGTGITAFLARDTVAPPPPPESFKAYSKKSEESNGVIAMMDLLVKDLDKEMTEAEAMEKDAQEDYEIFMKDSAEKRAEDSKAITDKEAAIAAMEQELQAAEDDKATASKELGALLEYIQSLHTECDWLLKYFEARKEARASEVEALGKAKAVLSGADYSMLQTGRRYALRRR